jgi:hypothetical protein
MFIFGIPKKKNIAVMVNMNEDDVIELSTISTFNGLDESLYARLRPLFGIPKYLTKGENIVSDESKNVILTPRAVKIGFRFNNLNKKQLFIIRRKRDVDGYKIDNMYTADECEILRIDHCEQFAFCTVKIFIGSSELTNVHPSRLYFQTDID